MQELAKLNTNPYLMLEKLQVKMGKIISSQSYCTHCIELNCTQARARTAHVKQLILTYVLTSIGVYSMKYIYGAIIRSMKLFLNLHDSYFWALSCQDGINDPTCPYMTSGLCSQKQCKTALGQFPTNHTT